MLCFTAAEKSVTFRTVYAVNNDDTIISSPGGGHKSATLQISNCVFTPIFVFVFASNKYLNIIILTPILLLRHYK